jgi:hypothetical protein
MGKYKWDDARFQQYREMAGKYNFMNTQHPDMKYILK